MNRRFYRIVFNARRGLRMAVQETATNTGKSPGTTSGALGAALATVLLASTAAHAQIAGAPDVPGTLRPTVLTAPNGVPLVNIQAPSPAGVSRNVYRQFDVLPNGVILNNSRTSVQTQLGGFVAGNPWLGRGPARVIVNEVNSGNPSLLRGAIEVAGPRTEVIVANPAGITVNGLTFLNTSRATLTTGVPQYNAFGGLASFAVREGSVTLEGLGLDASTTDSATILARAIQVNASLWANQLKVVGGANEVSADGGQATAIEGTGPRPAFLLDMTHRGSMYANRIFMEGTEHGLGVRNAGDGYVGMGEFIMKADGSLENRGTIQARRVAIEASGIDNRGGTIRQTGSSELEVTAPTLSNTNGGVVGTGTPSAGASPAASGGSTSVAGGGGTAPSTMPPAQPGSSGTAPALAYVPPAPGYLNARDGILNDAGQILAGGGVAMRVPRIDNAGGTLSLGSLSVAAPSFGNAGGTLRIAGAFNAQVRHFDNTGGTVQAGRMEIASAGDLLNRGGTLASEGAMNLTAVGAIDNRGGTLASDGSMNIAAGSLDNTGGHVATLGDLGVRTSGVTTNTAGSMLATGAATLANSGFVNTQGKAAGQNLAINTSSGALDNTAGFIGARDMLETNTQAFTNAAGGVVFGQGKVSVKTNGAAYDTRTRRCSWKQKSMVLLNASLSRNKVGNDRLC